MGKRNRRQAPVLSLILNDCILEFIVVVFVVVVVVVLVVVVVVLVVEFFCYDKIEDKKRRKGEGCSNLHHDSKQLSQGITNKQVVTRGILVVVVVVVVVVATLKTSKWLFS